MSGGGELLRALLDGLVSALGGSAKQGGRRSSSTSAAGRGSKPVAEWREPRGGSEVSRGSSASRDRDDSQSSPGQYGGDATRDLTPAELRGLQPVYAPQLDGEPDPGEVVWTWVPYVENDGRGKDRPVLIIARVDRLSWAACYLSTKEHRGFVSIGTGPWDSKGRESFLSPERVLRVTEHGMRRESTGIDRKRFEFAVSAVLRYHGIA